MFKKILVVFILACFAAAAPAAAEEVLVPEYGFSVDIPEGWKVLDASDLSAVSFTDPARRAVFQILAFPADRFASAAEITAHIRERFAARGEDASFGYRGRETALADLSFKAGRHEARGWFVFIDGASFDYALMAFAPAADFEGYNDLLLSCLDSFAPGEEARRYPGPVSSFYHPFPAPRPRETPIAFPGGSVAFFSGEGEPDANQTVIEREARILSQAKEGFKEAWKRHYRMIYRDTYMRLQPLAKGIEPLLKARAQDVPAALLAWFQDFSYARTKSLSDFQSPLSCVLSRSGDCDSLGMAYVILLEQLGFDAILLVSSEYGHAMAAVDIPGPGARFNFEGKGYLVAELTDRVDIGLIGKDVADPAKWIPVAFGRPIRR